MADEQEVASITPSESKHSKKIRSARRFGSFAFEILAFVLFMYGGITENIEDYLMIDALDDYKFEDGKDIRPDFAALVFISSLNTFIFLNVFLLVCCLCLVKLVLVWGSAKTVQRWAGIISDTIQLTVAVGAFWKLLAYGSILNKLRYHNLWEGSRDDVFRVDLLWIAGFDISFGVNKSEIPEELKNIIRKTAFNLFRTLWFFFPVVIIESNRVYRKFFGQVLFLIPSFFITCILIVTPLTNLMVFHYAQREFVEEGNFSMTPETNATVTSCIFAAILSGNLFWIFQTYVFTRFQNSEFYKKWFGSEDESKKKKKKTKVSKKISNTVYKGVRVGWSIHIRCNAFWSLFLIIFILCADIIVGSSLNIWNGYLITNVIMISLYLALFSVLLIKPPHIYVRKDATEDMELREEGNIQEENQVEADDV